MALSKDSKVIIVGTGTFGLSTALELSRKGYKDITCFDRDPVPSSYSAGNDSNKIFDSPIYVGEPDIATRIRLEAKKEWLNDPVFKPYFHPVGYIHAAMSEKVLNESSSVRNLKLQNPNAQLLNTPEKFRKYLKVFTGNLPNWVGYYMHDDEGWVHARDSLKSAYAECAKLGVNFVFGDDGYINNFEYDDSGKVRSIVSKSGKSFKGDIYALCCGANAVSLLDFKKQLESKCYTLAHIKLTKAEVEKYKNCPVIFNCEKGFFFEADENDEMKICNEFPGYTNVNDQGESIPFYANEIPLEAAEDVRQYLKETMPELSEKPFVKTKICWITDSPDMELIITVHPEHSNLIVGSGDAGESFMIMPVIGKYIAKVVMNGNTGLTEDEQKNWRWRPETSYIRDNIGGRYGGCGYVKDLKSIKEWVSVENPEAHSLF